MSGPEQLAALAQNGQFWLLGGVFVAATLIEAWRPERSRLLPRAWRWTTSLGLFVLSNWLFRVIAPISIAFWLLAALGKPHVVAFAHVGAWGGPWAVLVASCLVLDVLTYL